MSFQYRFPKTTAWQDGMLRNLATKLISHERISMVHSRAKRLQQEVEKLVTIAKKGDLPAIRYLHGFLRTEKVNKQSVVDKLLRDLAPRYANRNGGYTRVLRTSPRKGDNADMCIIEFIK